jgi:hypothetical protein
MHDDRGVETSLLGLLLLLAAVGAACGKVSALPDGAGGTGGADAGMEAVPLTADAACMQFAQAYCGVLETCPAVLQVYYGDANTCVTRTKLACVTDQMSPGIARTPNDIVACTNAASSATCADVVDNNLPAACQVSAGTVVNGGGCGSSWQCMSTHCEKSGSSVCGTCAVRQPVNGTCTVNEGCVAGLLCANGKCAMPVALGAACSNNVPCSGYLYCDKTTQICSAYVESGASCASDSSACDLLNGYGCNPFTHVCQSVGVANGGGECGLVNSTLVVCIVLDNCSGATLTKPGVCASPAQDGTACDDNMHCLPPATCVNQLCRLPSSGSCQ